MQKVKNRLMWIGLIGLVVALLCVIYPLYVHWVEGNYTKKFAVVLNSHDMKQYDEFFSKDTVFELNGEEIEYSKARETIKKVIFYYDKEGFLEDFLGMGKA